MSNADLGTVRAAVRLELKALQDDRNKAKGILTQMTGDIKAELQALTSQVTAGMAATSAAITAGLGAAVTVGSAWQTKLQQVAANTNMTTQQMEQMRQSVEGIGKSAGAPLDQLADGYMHVTNFGFKAGEATEVLTAAMKSAVSTGGDTGKTAEMLANVMHEFGLKTSQASAAMNVLHTSAAKGNMVLEQLVEAGGPAFAMAANLGLGLTDVAAAMSALTQHGFNAAEAATQVRNVIAHIAEPARGTAKELQRISKLTGVDLVGDFTTAGLKLATTIAELRAALAVLSAASAESAAGIPQHVRACRAGSGGRCCWSRPVGLRPQPPLRQRREGFAAGHRVSAGAGRICQESQ